MLGAEGVAAALDDQELPRVRRDAVEGLGLRDRHGLVAVAVDDQPRCPALGGGSLEVEDANLVLEVGQQLDAELQLLAGAGVLRSAMRALPVPQCSWVAASKRSKVPTPAQVTSARNRSRQSGMGRGQQRGAGAPAVSEERQAVRDRRGPARSPCPPPAGSRRVSISSRLKVLARKASSVGDQLVAGAACRCRNS